MRGNQVIRRRTLGVPLVFIMIAIGLCGCSILHVWNGDGLTEPGIAAAAVPTQAVEPDAEVISPPSMETASDQPLPIVEQPLPTPSQAPEGEHRYLKSKLVALTFDDGPDAKYTPQILDILKEHDVKATFFMVGLQVMKYPDVALRIVEEGHSIGNHSWSHHDLTKLSAKVRDEEVEKAQQAIIEATGVTPQLMRAPYGAISKNVLESIHADRMKHVYWTVDTKDWAGSTVSEMHKNVMTNTRKGGIILMHSFGGRKHAIEHTIELLPTIIEDLRGKGYELVTVEELIESGQFLSSVIK